jgi:subtilase family serine protease
VLPELAETRLNPPLVTDLRQDFAAYDRLFHLPTPRLKVVSTFPGATHPWLAFGEEVLDAEVVHAIAPRAALTIVLVKGTSLDVDALGGSLSGFTPRKEVILVASDPLVLSAGGTTLDASHATGAWIGETAWGLPDGSAGSAFQASGGGFSHLFSRPAYQNGVQGIGSMRGVPDVAADGDPATGIAVITGSPLLSFSE